MIERGRVHREDGYEMPDSERLFDEDEQRRLDEQLDETYPLVDRNAKEN